MSRSLTAVTTCSSAAAGSAPGWAKTRMPSRNAIRVGIEVMPIPPASSCSASVSTFACTMSACSEDDVSKIGPNMRQGRTTRPRSRRARCHCLRSSARTSRQTAQRWPWSSLRVRIRCPHQNRGYPRRYSAPPSGPRVGERRAVPLRHNPSMTETADFLPVPEEPSGWLSTADLGRVRRQVPILYVDAVPVRVDPNGRVTEIGLLLRANPAGAIWRALVSGRVHYGEQIRDALLRHLEKDLGPMALPRIPASPQPFTVAEYFPTPGVTAYHDPRQHAVSLAYVVPIDGDCQPQQSAIDLAWVTPQEAASTQVQLDMLGGQGMLLRQALAHVGRLV